MITEKQKLRTLSGELSSQLQKLSKTFSLFYASLDGPTDDGNTTSDSVVQSSGEDPAETPRERFIDWYSERGAFDFVSGSELLFKGSGHSDKTHDGFGLNTVPPEELWENILPTAGIVSQVRLYFDRPVILTSIYRSPLYNLAVGSSNPTNPMNLTGPGSYHPRFNAIDFKVSGVPPSAVAERLREMRKDHEFTGGIGTYSTFVHVDTRPYDSDW